VANYFIKTERRFTNIRRFGWLFTVLVGIGGLFEPKLGLLVIPIMISLTAMSFFKGRYWCGNFCPHGSLFDSLFIPFGRNTKIYKFMKSKYMMIGFMGFFAFNLSRKIVGAAQFWGESNFLDKLGFVFVTTYLMVIIVGGSLSMINSGRTWCQICPMGVMEKLSYSLGKLLKANKSTDVKVTISDKDACHKCGKCARVCPMQISPYTEFNENNQFDNSNCIKCSTCVVNCPAGILSIDKEEKAIEVAAQSAARREVLLNAVPQKQHIEAEITEIRELASDLREYKFKFISPRRVAYKPGQFMILKIEDNPESYRAYSISGWDPKGSSVGVIIKRVEDGYGTEKIFDNYTLGSTVELEGPMGDELIVDKSAKKLLFIGNGIGITPFIPLVEDSILNKPESLERIDLVYGVRKSEDLIYDDFFSNYDSSSSLFNYHKIASREEIDDKKGYVMDVLKELDVSDSKVYICGSKAMVSDTVKLLKEKGLSESDIFVETA
jgi:NAD(P)H-flavin reductase/ferredoxin